MVPFVVASAANFRSAFPLALHRARRAFRTHESPAPQAFGLTVPPTLLAAPCGDQLLCVAMSAIGTKRTSLVALHRSAFGYSGHAASNSKCRHWHDCASKKASRTQTGVLMIENEWDFDRQHDRVQKPGRVWRARCARQLHAFASEVLE
jgi:hypothetical protein